MDNEIEKRLIKKAIAGDDKAFEKIVFTYEKTIYNIAFYMFHNEQDAYDISQEVFIKIYKNLKNFKFDSSLSTWIHRIAKNMCIDELRKRKKLKNDIYMDEAVESTEGNMKMQFEDDEPTPEARIIQLEDKNNIQEAINRLNEDQRIIIILRHIKGYSYEEISEILEINTGTVKSRLNRARKALKEIIINKMEHT